MGSHSKPVAAPSINIGTISPDIPPIRISEILPPPLLVDVVDPFLQVPFADVLGHLDLVVRHHVDPPSDRVEVVCRTLAVDPDDRLPQDDLQREHLVVRHGFETSTGQQSSRSVRRSDSTPQTVHR